MVSPSATIDDDDDDEFDEYNPHPYQGGYDIALTYGHPLPPSHSTCYPVSGGSGHLPKPQPPSPPESGHRPEPPALLPPPPPHPDSGHRSAPPAPLPLPPPPESDHHPEPTTPPRLPPPPESGHHPELPSAPPPEPSHRPESDYRSVNYRPWPDFDNFGFWPFQTECQRCCADGEGLGYWHQLKRAGDYLFGYSEGYGERRIGVDSYGIPIYANKKEGLEAVTVEIEPARDMKVECYDSENGNENCNYANLFRIIVDPPVVFPSHEKNDGSYGYAYNKHHYEEPLHAQENLIELMLDHQSTYYDANVEQVYPKLEGWPSSYEEEDRSYGYAYNKHHYKESLHVEENLAEPMLYQRLAYHEVYDEQPYPVLETVCCFGSSVFEEFNEVMPLTAFEGSKLHEADLYPYDSHHPSYGEHDDETGLYGNNQYAYERYDKEQPLCVELEAYKPSWSQNLHYVEFYAGESSLAYNSHSSMDNVVGDERNIFGEYDSAHGRNSYEQPVCVQLEPYKTTWAKNPTFYESYGQEISQSTWVDHASKENGAQYFGSLFEYSQHNE